jgi:23S rRNA pseudouridine2605 synthase
MSTQRLQKILAQAGVASRRAAEQLILDGRVRVNGRIVRELGTRANPARDRVEVNGRRLVAEKPVYYLLHKPRGVVTTLDDPEGRKTVKDLLRDVPERVFPVGRLDFHTSGVLLLTNDGALAQALLHPKRAVPKTYNAKLQGQLDQTLLDTLRAGVVLDDGEKTAPAEVCLVRSDGKHTALEITIAEGKNRQIHRMGEAIGCPVLRLTRVSFAGLTLERLQVGQKRQLTPRELAELKQRYLHADARPRARGVPFAAAADVGDIEVAHPTLARRTEREPRGRNDRRERTGVTYARPRRIENAGAEPRRTGAGRGQPQRALNAGEEVHRGSRGRPQPSYTANAGEDARRSSRGRVQPRHTANAGEDARRMEATRGQPRRTQNTLEEPRRSNGPWRAQPQRSANAREPLPRRTTNAAQAKPRRGLTGTDDARRTGHAHAKPRRGLANSGVDPRRTGPAYAKPKRGVNVSDEPRKIANAGAKRTRTVNAADESRRIANLQRVGGRKHSK